MTDFAYYDGIAKELRDKCNRLRSFIKHWGSIGSHHEEILRETLRSMISPRFQLRTGFSFASKDLVSRQGDILVVDEHDPVPYLFKQGDFVVVQPRALVCVIEVKTTLTKKAFLEAVENLASFQDVADVAAPTRHPGTFVFAFDGPSPSTERMDGWYRSVKRPHLVKYYPNYIFVLKRGMLRTRYEGDSRPFGHHFIIDDGSVKSRSLSVMLAGIRKYVEMRDRMDSNPYEHACLDGLRWSRQHLRFGAGLVDDPSAEAGK